MVSLLVEFVSGMESGQDIGSNMQHVLPSTEIRYLLTRSLVGSWLDPRSVHTISKSLPFIMLNSFLTYASATEGIEKKSVYERCSWVGERGCVSVALSSLSRHHKWRYDKGKTHQDMSWAAHLGCQDTPCNL